MNLSTQKSTKMSFHSGPLANFLHDLCEETDQK